MSSLKWVVGTMALLALSFAPAAKAAGMVLSSPIFQNGGTLPASMIFNRIENGRNLCTVNGSAGGDHSPELAWRGVPPGTRSLAVMMFDATASFTHWGLYNIPATSTGLADNAGQPGGAGQVVNDFGIAGYSGPCPPAGVTPATHHYVITLYALRIRLSLPVARNFPQNAETLEQALITACETGQILGRASITGTYSAPP